MTYAIITLGCKLNQFDSALIAGKLGAASGQARSVEEADLILLNTCTVTHRADREARRLARSLKRSNPRALLAVMGCSARLNETAFRNMPEVNEVLPDEASVRSFLARHAEALTGAAWRPWFGERTRAYLKVQEGCGFPCTYCIVPSVRGPSRSVPPEEVLEGFKLLLDAGYKEIVLTGINTGEYGKDSSFRGGLPALLEMLLKTEGCYRIRLNSVEPKAVTPGLISLMKREKALARHLQIPMQNGSDRVLRAMRRNYRTAFYIELLRKLAEEIPGIGLGADVLAGYPTETCEDFRSTLSLIENSPLAFLHAFSYSPRPGTPAARLAPLEPREVHARTNTLRALGEKKKAAFASGFIGKSLDALTLVSGGGSGRALTTNFLDVELDKKLGANAFVKVHVTSVSEGKVTGRVEAESSTAL